MKDIEKIKKQIKEIKEKNKQLRQCQDIKNIDIDEDTGEYYEN